MTTVADSDDNDDTILVCSALVVEMDDSVSAFIAGTCRVLQKSSTDVFKSILVESSNSGQEYKIVCGSTVEFFIQPLHSCIGDFDALELKAYYLAFTDEKPVLPHDMRHIADRVCCFSIEPYCNYPSFVRLRHFGHLRYNWSRQIFDFIGSCYSCRTLFNTPVTCPPEELGYNVESSMVGPALKYVGTISGSCDIVASMWCPQWPKEAKDWPSRRRKCAWPTTAIIHKVVHNGCHVVFAKHPACRSDVHQCRLSFSVAEIILLQSWTHVQQTVYHMLRFFAKRELFKKDCSKEDEVLCSYHLKTLMLWSCEQMSTEWWISSSVIKICCNLLQKLVKWLKQKRCPNYFIPQANLFHEHYNRKKVDETAERLIYFYNSNILSLWFVKHYMQPIFPLTVNTRCMQDVCEAMKAAEPKSIDLYFSRRFSYDVDEAHKVAIAKDGTQFSNYNKYILRIASKFSDANNFPPATETESCFCFYASMLRLLHAAHLLDCKEVNYNSERFYEIIIRQVSISPKLFRSKYHNFPKPRETGISKSQLLLMKAQDLMENLATSNDGAEFKLVSQMSGSLLRRALEYEESKAKTLARAILSYMAALHFAALEYEAAIGICSRLIVINPTHEKENTQTLNAGCLLYIEDICKIIGFYLIFIQIKYNLNYKRRWVLLDLRLTPEVFAHYLTIASIVRTAGCFRLNNISHTPTYPLDVMLMTMTNRKCSGVLPNSDVVSRMNQRSHTMNKMKALNEIFLPNEDSIIQLLMEFSLENMTSFYNAICKDFGIQCSTVDCYRAAYLCKCRKYSEVLHLCERILDEPSLQSDLKELAFANVMVLPPLDSFFDTDIQCLLGFYTMFFYFSPLNEYFSKVEDINEPKFQQSFARRIYHSRLLLSISLACSMKFHYFMEKRFLARYLKVRCLIDCNHSFSDVESEFKKLKACFPFEHIVRCFLEKKLQQLQKVLMQITVQDKVCFNGEKT